MSKDGDRIRLAQDRVLKGIRPYLYFNEGGTLCIQLNEPNRENPISIGPVIHHGLELSKHHPEAIETLNAVVRGWVMGVASTLGDE